MKTNAIRLLSATAAGIGVGVVAAVVIPTASSRVTETPFRAPKEPLRIGKAFPSPVDALATKAVPGTVKIVARRPDPTGGPTWAVRVFTADQVGGASRGNTVAPPTVVQGGHIVDAGGTTQAQAGQQRCVQLGRILHGQFGWIDGTNVFHPTATTDPLGETMSCVAPDPTQAHQPFVASTTLVDGPETRNPIVRGAVVWGMLGPGVTAAQLHTGHRSLVPARSKQDGAFLEFFGPARTTSDASAVVHYGKAVVDTGGPIFSPNGAMARHGLAAPIDRASGALIARAADPGGGPSWGALGYRSKTGLSCVGSAGYLVDGRVGTIEAKLGTLSEPEPGESFTGCGKSTQPSKRNPLMFTGESGSNPGQSQIEPDRGALRLQSGRTLMWGQALPTVESITFETARDIRTVVPTEPRHGFMVVYAGSASFGMVSAVIRFKDGHTQRQELGMLGGP